MKSRSTLESVAGEFFRGLLGEFNKLSIEEQQRLLDRNDQYSKAVREARRRASGLSEPPSGRER